MIGPAVSNMIDGKGLNNLIALPTGCGEQTMLKLAPNVFILNYLRSTKQVTDQIEGTAFGFIRSGEPIYSFLFNMLLLTFKCNTV